MLFVRWLFQAFFLPFHCFIPYFSPAIRDTHIHFLIVDEFVPLVLPFLGLWVTGSQVLDPRVPVLRFLDPWVPCSLGPRFVFNPPKWGGSTTTSKKSYNTQQVYNFYHFVPMWTLVRLGWDYLCNKNIRFKSTVTLPVFKVRKEGLDLLWTYPLSEVLLLSCCMYRGEYSQIHLNFIYCIQDLI